MLTIPEYTNQLLAEMSNSAIYSFDAAERYEYNVDNRPVLKLVFSNDENKI